MVIVIFRNRLLGDKWVVTRRVENTDAATVSESVVGEFDDKAEADFRLEQLNRENSLIDQD